MTITSESEDSNGGEFVQMEHETPEKCLEYLNSTEFCLKSNGILIENFPLIEPRKISRILGSPLLVRGLPWKLFVYQNFQNAYTRKLCIVILCDISTESQWSCFSACQVTLVNHTDPKRSICKNTSFFYTYKDYQVVIDDIIPMEELYESNCPYIVDNSFQLKFTVTADPPRGLSWDSKKISGYVGLINQGATCYLNSLLQTLYFAEPLKKIIFKAPTEIDNRSRSVVLALQQTFLELLYSKTSVNTKKLTSSFGWSQSESYHQHDVQEMCRLLIDHIETKTKGTIVDGEISRLLEGKSQVSIKCINVDFESKRTESFYDIQLSVKGMKNIYESFDQYCSSELLEDSNKYHSSLYGLQDALKHISFLEFPPLLHLHLLRFVVNTVTYNYEKVCDRFEFPRQLQLDKYLSEESESKHKNDVYLLQSVLVHCGSTSGGHYIAYVSPNCDSIWYKFDDDIVSIVSECDALDNNFGSNENRQRTAYTAYMLLYIKSSMLNNPNYKFTESDIPSFLTNLYVSERNINKQEALLNFNKCEYIEVNVIFDDSLFLSPTNRIIDMRMFKPLSFYMSSEYNLSDITFEIALHMGIPSNRLRVWFLRSRRGFDMRPISVCSEIFKHPFKRILDRSDISLLIETIKEEQEEYIGNQHLMIFLHTYCPKMQKILYQGFYRLNKSLSIEVALEELCLKLEIPFNSQTLIFTQTDSFHVEMLFNKSIIVGDVFKLANDFESIVIQTDYDTSASFHISKYPFEYVDHFLDDFIDHFTINFFDATVDSFEPDFTLNLSKKMKIEHLLENVSHKLGVDPIYVRLFKGKISPNLNCYIKHSYSGTLSEIFTTLNRSSDIQRLYYQILRVPCNVVDDKIMYNMLFCNKNGFQKLIPIFLYSNQKSLECVYHTFLQVAEVYDLNITTSLRFVNCSNPLLQIIQMSNDDESSMFDDIFNRRLRIEEIPEDQLNLQGCEKLITVNVRVKSTEIIALQMSFFIKISSKSTYQDIVSSICQRNLKSSASFSLFHINEKVIQSFPGDLNINIPIHQLLTNSNSNICNKDIIDTATILMEVIENNPSRPYSKSDPSIKIYT